MEQNNSSQLSDQGGDIPSTVPLPTPLPLYEKLGTFVTLHENALQSQKKGGPSTKTATSQHSLVTVSLLQSRLQKLQLGEPIWDITVEPGTEHVARRFIGTLSMGQDLLPEKMTVSIVEPDANPMGAGLPSKKDVKAKLAQKALHLLEAMPALPKRSDTSTAAVAKKKDGDEDGINWIGRIVEYNNSIPMEHRVLTYMESTSTTASSRNPGPSQFSCTLDLAIPTSSLASESQSFAPYTTCKFPAAGVPPPMFPSKKGARYHSSRLAGLELISLGLLQNDGNLPPKSTVVSPQSHIASNEPPVSNFIPQRCDQLGLTPPRYEFTSPSGDLGGGDAFVDCSAHFPPIFGLPDPLAVVRNVYGKKRAKEECARALMNMLDKVEQWRLKGSGPWEES